MNPETLETAVRVAVFVACIAVAIVLVARMDRP